MSKQERLQRALVAITPILATKLVERYGSRVAFPPDARMNAEGGYDPLFGVELPFEGLVPEEGEVDLLILEGLLMPNLCMNIEHHPGPCDIFLEAQETVGFLSMRAGPPNDTEKLQRAFNAVNPIVTQQLIKEFGSRVALPILPRTPKGERYALAAQPRIFLPETGDVDLKLLTDWIMNAVRIHLKGNTGKWDVFLKAEPEWAMVEVRQCLPWGQ
jgi:hypothetical protein